MFDTPPRLASNEGRKRTSKKLEKSLADGGAGWRYIVVSGQHFERHKALAERVARDLWTSHPTAEREDVEQTCYLALLEHSDVTDPDLLRPLIKNYARKSLGLRRFVDPAQEFVQEYPFYEEGTDGADDYYSGDHWLDETAKRWLLEAADGEDLAIMEMYCEGHTAQAIADATGLPRITVRRRVQAVIDRIRDEHNIETDAPVQWQIEHHPQGPYYQENASKRDRKSANGEPGDDTREAG